MRHYAAFNQGLHCYHRQKLSSEEEMQFLFGIYILWPSIYTMGHPKLIERVILMKPK